MLGSFNSENLGSLSFGLGIEGDFDNITEVRLTLVGEKCNFLVEGSLDSKSEEVSFDLTNLQSIIPSGNYKAKMEVILDGNRYFNPLNESLSIKRSPKVEAVTKEIEVVEQKETKVKVNSTSIKIKSPKEVWLESQEKLGYNIVKTKDGLVSYKDRQKVAEFKE